MIKRVKLETIYKIAKEDNKEIEECKTFPDGDEPVPEWLIKKYEEQIREDKAK